MLLRTIEKLIQREAEFQELPKLLESIQGTFFTEINEGLVFILIHLPGSVELSQGVSSYENGKLYMDGIVDMVNILANPDIFNEIHKIICNKTT